MTKAKYSKFNEYVLENYGNVKNFALAMGNTNAESKGNRIYPLKNFPADLCIELASELPN
jgi:hypothetical protein